MPALIRAGLLFSDFTTASMKNNQLIIGIFLVAVLSVVMSWLLFGRTEVAVHPPTTFTDVRHGFSLVLPPSWFGVQTLTISAPDYDYVAFTHPVRLGSAGRDGKLEFSVFILDRPEEQAPDGAMTISERNGIRYAWLRTPAALPPGLEQAASDLNGIVASFVSSGIQ